MAHVLSNMITLALAGIAAMHVHVAPHRYTALHSHMHITSTAHNDSKCGTAGQQHPCINPLCMLVETDCALQPLAGKVLRLHYGATLLHIVDPDMPLLLCHSVLTAALPCRAAADRSNAGATCTATAAAAIAAATKAVCARCAPPGE